MVWTKIESNRNVMLEAQWIFRTENAPVCSLKKDKEVPGRWQASLLNRSGISALLKEIDGAPLLAEAQRQCEVQLRLMGWSWT
jgi:hypothetical protein